MQVFRDGRVRYQFVLRVDADLFRAEEIEDILGLQPALVELLELLARYLTVSPHLQDPASTDIYSSKDNEFSSGTLMAS